MAAQDTSQLKERIVSIIKLKGPSLPVHIAKGINQSMLFTSAFLSELLSEKKLKISKMRVGSSPIYLIQGQEEGIENFSNHLKSKEKDAFILLKEKSFLKDVDQEPAIRVALRAIKDFAIPFKKQDEIYWRYISVSEADFPEPKGVPQNNQGRIVEGKKDLNIFDDSEKKEIKKTVKKKIAKKKSPQKVNEKFFNTVKEYLAERQIEILDIVGFSKVDLILRVKVSGRERLLVAYNKKSLREADVIKAHKKAKELDLKYILLSLGEPLKKLGAFIEAVQDLEKIEKIEK